MKKRIKMLPRLMLLLLLAVFFFSGKRAYASAGTGTEYITISVKASDDNGDLQYAIDEPVNFSEKNTFTIPAGSSHTIYVKDAAGNITSQQYPATASSNPITGPESDPSPALTTQRQEVTAGSGEQEIDIDLELGLKPDGISAGGEASASVRSGDDENYEYLTDTVVEKPAAAVQSKTTTDGSDTAKKVFYDIVTAEGETFYLVIDQGASNTVHLLNKVTLKDLEAIAAAADDSASPAVTEEKEDNLLEALKRSETGSDAEAGAGAVQKASAEKGNNDMLLLIGVVALAAGGYYYFKVYKNKKNETMDAMDAMDMDDFQPEDEEDEDEEEIEFDEDRKQKMLDDLISSDGYATENELYDTDPEEYVADEVPEPDTEDSKISEPDEEESEREPFTDAEDNRFVDEEFAEALSAAEEFDEELDGEEE